MSENETAEAILTEASHTLPDTDETDVISYGCDILAGLTRMMQDIASERIQPDD